MTTKTKLITGAAISAAIAATLLIIEPPYATLTIDRTGKVTWGEPNTVLMTTTNLYGEWSGATSNHIAGFSNMVGFYNGQRFYRLSPMAITDEVWWVRLAWNHSISTNVTGYTIRYGNLITNVGYVTNIYMQIPIIMATNDSFSIRATNAWTNSEPTTLSNLAIKL